MATNNEVMLKVEDMVCECVNIALLISEGSIVTSENVYSGKKNIPFARAVARNFIFDVLHNKYGFSYAVVAQRGNCNRESVMRCVRKCHYLAFTDKIYKEVRELITSKLQEWYGE